jgi:phage tail-like protein
VGVYGIDVYAQTRFGRDPSLIRPDYSIEPFESLALDYATLHLTWVRPNSTDCIYLRLIRNAHNLPQNQDDGAYLWGDATTTPPYMDFVQRTASFTDSNLGSGFYYYTMWGYSQSDQDWVRCSDLIALVPINWGYGNRFYSLLPMTYRDQDGVLVDPYNPWPVNSPQPPLQRFLQLLGFQMDFIRTELESLTSVNDPMNCSGALLPLLAQEFGLVNEPVIGMQQERTLIANAIHLYKLKGSPRGISEFVSILTSYPMTTLAHHGYNCLLSRDDSIAEDAIGTWQAWPPSYTHFPPVTNPAGLALTQVPDLLNIAGMTNPLETYTGFEPGPNPEYNDTGMRVTATAAGDRWITTGRIPITDFMSQSYGPGYVTWRIQIWSSVARTVRISLWGDVGNGVPVSIIPETSFTETVGHWTMMTATAAINPYPNGPTEQAAYYWLFPVIHIVGAAANEFHYLTLMGLWPCQPGDIGINTPVYDYPRDVKVILSPQSANLLSNTLTSFTYGFDGLTPAADPTQSSVNFTCGLTILYTSPETPAGVYTVNGLGSLQVAANSPGATVWFGEVNAWTQPLPTEPYGWFSHPATNWAPPSDAGDWYPGATLQAPTRTWFDPVNGWFTMNNQYFTLGTPVFQGNWFPPAVQPPLNGNLEPFVVPSYQPFNFSVYAEYLSVMDPSNAVMQIGFRWYYPDDTWAEVFMTYTLTGVLTRYSCPPPDPSQYWMGNPPDEAITDVQPTEMYCFVRFPYAQSAQFLLNSAMLSPGQALPPYFDITMFPGDSDYVEDSHGGSYYYMQRDARTERLDSELYRWIPMGASYTEIFGAGTAIPPLDPTEWTHPAVALHGTTTLTVTETVTGP